MMELKDNGIVLIEDTHSYLRGSQEFHGITGAIAKYINNQKYNKVSDDVLQSAAERGSSIHAAIELFCTCGMKTATIPELDDFISIKEENKLDTVANEYIVTDEEYYASPIDYVCKTPDCEENEVCIIDFKSTSSVDEMRLAVQLTAYKMFFEANNPELQVKRVGVIWLPKDEYGQPKLKWTETVDETAVKMLLNAARNDDEFHSAVITKEYPLPDRISNMETRIGGCITIGKAIDEYLKQFKADLLEEMLKNDVRSYIGEHLKINITKGYSKAGGYDQKALLNLINGLIADYDDDEKLRVRKKIEECKKPDTFVSDSLSFRYT